MFSYTANQTDPTVEKKMYEDDYRDVLKLQMREIAEMVVNVQ